MRGVKVATAVLTIIEGVGALLGGIAVAVMGGFVGDLFVEILERIGFQWLLNFIPFEITTFFIVAGAIIAVLGVVFLVLGIKFCSRNPNKGIAITLLVLSILTANIIVLVLAIIYLAKVSDQENGNYQNTNY